MLPSIKHVLRGKGGINASSVAILTRTFGISGSNPSPLIPSYAVLSSCVRIKQYDQLTRHHHTFSSSCCSSDKSPAVASNSDVIRVAPSYLNNNLRIIKRSVSIYGPLFNETDKEEAVSEVIEDDDSDEKEEGKSDGSSKKQARKGIAVARHLDRDRSKIIPLEKSIRYLKSAAYRETYGDEPVWVPYRRNFPGQFAPKKTRKTCIRYGKKDTEGLKIATGNPCPICRDIYLVVDYRHVELLKQFISPHTGEVLGWDKTGVCRRQQNRLLIEIDKAKDYGTLTFDVPFREYNYKDYEKIYDSY